MANCLIKMLPRVLVEKCTELAQVACSLITTSRVSNATVPETPIQFLLKGDDGPLRSAVNYAEPLRLLAKVRPVTLHIATYQVSGDSGAPKKDRP
jgi:hypothetical protein